MKRWWVAIMTVLVFSSCHSHRQEEHKDSVCVIPSEQKPMPNMPHSIPEEQQVAVPPIQEESYQELHKDTAEITNLRLFSRKQRTIYSPALLVGEWQSGSEHEQYMSDGSGQRWDTKDDVYREEAQLFTWKMDSNLLTIRFEMALGGLMLRNYIVAFVDDETLVYRDAYDGMFMFDKVPAGFTDRP